MATAIEVDLADLTDDLAEIVNRIVWSTVTTCDRLGRPRSRIMHPVWEITPDRVTGVIGSFPTPTKQAHIARSPWLTCGYWSPDHDAAFIDCHATWAADTHDAWTRLTAGYDPTTIWPNGPTSPNFAALLLTPHRIQIIRGADVSRGAPTPMWTASRTTETVSSTVTKI
ncbi:pyridoxamine 5'-phosphate oxidase [Actinocrispum sp. NPDC049592]|uniref:pyridoxamine 5'-phosphate oxidase n=1 Tax=Actinocrispum sp. NPDC049592 TaxID=3154835 RepID=UPI0034287BB5